MPIRKSRKVHRKGKKSRRVRKQVSKKRRKSRRRTRKSRRRSRKPRRRNLKMKGGEGGKDGEDEEKNNPVNSKDMVIQSPNNSTTKRPELSLDVGYLKSKAARKLAEKTEAVKELGQKGLVKTKKLGQKGVSAIGQMLNNAKTNIGTTYSKGKSNAGQYYKQKMSDRTKNKNLNSETFEQWEKQIKRIELVSSGRTLRDGFLSIPNLIAILENDLYRWKKALIPLYKENCTDIDCKNLNIERDCKKDQFKNLIKDKREGYERYNNIFKHFNPFFDAHKTLIKQMRSSVYDYLYNELINAKNSQYLPSKEAVIDLNKELTSFLDYAHIEELKADIETAKKDIPVKLIDKKGAVEARVMNIEDDAEVAGSEYQEKILKERQARHDDLNKKLETRKKLTQGKNEEIESSSEN